MLLSKVSFKCYTQQQRRTGNHNSNNNSGIDLTDIYHAADYIPQNGLPNSTIACIPIHISRKEQKKEICPVCRENFEQDRFYQQLSCGHLFHSNCLGEWLSRNTNCPICRQTVTVPK